MPRAAKILYITFTMHDNTLAGTARTHFKVIRCVWCAPSASHIELRRGRGQAAVVQAAVATAAVATAVAAKAAVATVVATAAVATAVVATVVATAVVATAVVATVVATAAVATAAVATAVVASGGDGGGGDGGGGDGGGGKGGGGGGGGPQLREQPARRDHKEHAVNAGAVFGYGAVRASERAPMRSQRPRNARISRAPKGRPEGSRTPLPPV